ncbi:MAG: hypothetical protein RL767_1079, partial [Bacteroidota bacterium]
CNKKRRPRGVAFYAFETKISKWQIVVVVGLVKARRLLRSGTSNGVSSSAKIAALVASVSAAAAVVAALVASVSAAALVSSVATAAVVAATVSAAVVAVRAGCASGFGTGAVPWGHTPSLDAHEVAGFALAVGPLAAANVDGDGHFISLVVPRWNVCTILSEFTHNYLRVILVGFNYYLALAKSWADLLGLKKLFNGSGKFHGYREKLIRGGYSVSVLWVFRRSTSKAFQALWTLPLSSCSLAYRCRASRRSIGST